MSAAAGAGGAARFPASLSPFGLSPSRVESAGAATERGGPGRQPERRRSAGGLFSAVVLLTD